VLVVEAGAPLCKFSIVQVNGETSLLNLTLVDSNAPKGEKHNMVVGILFVETFIPTVVADILLLGHPTCKDKVKRGGRVCCEDLVAEEESGKESQEALEVDGATSNCGGSGEGGKIVNCEAVGNVHSAGDGHLDGMNDCLMVNNGKDGYGAHSNKASHLVCGEEEVSAKVVGIMEDGDLLHVVHRKEKTVVLIELHHLYVKVGFKVYHASVTGDVPVAGIIHLGERVEESFPGGLVDQGYFLFL
jgi:hypothetical protein